MRGLGRGLRACTSFDDLSQRKKKLSEQILRSHTVRIYYFFFPFFFSFVLFRQRLEKFLESNWNKTPQRDPLADFSLAGRRRAIM